MLYLATIGWPWLAGALALGLAVGWLTTRRSPDDSAGSGRWFILLVALALVGGGALIFLQILPGRGGATLEIGWLMTLAYGVGLPLGAFAKGRLPAPAAAPKKPPVAVMRGAARLEEKYDEEAPTPAPIRPRAPIVVAPNAQVETPRGPAQQDQPQVEAQDRAPETAPSKPPESPARAKPAPAAAKPAAAKPAKAAGERAGRKQADKTPERKGFPGAQPSGLPAPRGAPDDLTKIKGIGPKSVDKLNALGVYHYDQIAEWTIDNAKWVGAALGIPGRVERGKWIQQARELAAARKSAEMSPRENA